MKKVLILFDSMKECISSRQAATAVAEGIVESGVEAEIITREMADGGEGTLAALSQASDMALDHVPATDITGQQRDIPFLFQESTGTAFIEMASVCSIGLIDPATRNPMNHTSAPLGSLILKVKELGAKNIVVALGGSATVDCGIGMLAELGAVFYDADGIRLPAAVTSLAKVAGIDTETLKANLSGLTITALCDVTSPLCGIEGAARTFGPQKGLKPLDCLTVDGAIARFADAMGRVSGLNPKFEPYCGAAGGVSAALWSLCGASVVSGASYILSLLDIDTVAEEADLIITGEGQIDGQTSAGKVAYAVARMAKRAGTRCVAIGGRVITRMALINAGCTEVYQASSFAEIVSRKALLPEVACANIRRTSEIISTKYLR